MILLTVGCRYAGIKAAPLQNSRIAATDSYHINFEPILNPKENYKCLPFIPH